jgi:hypothetical protein
MTLINNNVKKIILNSLENILNISDESWTKLESNIKLKIIHHYCNYFSKKIKDINWDSIHIPLKSLKPKKLIQLLGFNNNYNKTQFTDFNEQILKYTFEFREQYNQKDKKNYVLSSLAKDIYNSLLNKYTKIIYDFINQNIKCINPINIYNNLVLNNKDKLISNTVPDNFNINLNSNKITLKFNNNIELIFELEFYNDRITNNLPVIFNQKLINSF